MADPTGRWLNTTQWQCPKCSWVNGSADESCQKCGRSVRPSENEPVRPPDALDLISHDEARVGNARPVEFATKAAHTLSRVTREKARALIGESLRTALTKRGEQGNRAWQAIAELPESDQSAALDSVVEDLEDEGVVLYRVGEDEAG
jgi:hypothetical protein